MDKKKTELRDFPYPENWEPEDDIGTEWDSLFAAMQESDIPKPVSSRKFDAVRLEARFALEQEGVLVDQEWESVSKLIHAAENPEPPTKAHLKAIHLETRRQLIREGVLEETPAKEKAEGEDLSFGQWVQLLLSGGRTGGQIVRLGLAASVAFIVGIQMSQTDSPSSISREDSTSVTQVPSSIQAEKAEPESGERVAAADVSEPIVTASLSSPKTERLKTAEVPAEPNATGGGVEAPDNAFASAEATASEARSTQGRFVTEIPRALQDTSNTSSNWDITAPVQNTWRMSEESNVSSVPVAAAYGPRREPQGSLSLQAMNQLQNLKLKMMLQGDGRLLEDVTRIEGMLSEIIQKNEWTAEGKGGLIERYQSAERARLSRRWDVAIPAYQQISQDSGLSWLAVMAEFQIAEIAFEEIYDYELSLESYLKCLKEYPGQDLSKDTEDYIRARVDILKEGIEDQWQSLRHFQIAQSGSMSDSETVLRLMRVVESSPSLILVKKSAEQLKDIMIADSLKRELNHLEVIDVLRTSISRLKDDNTKALIQLYLAEIVERRGQNFVQAYSEYRRVIAMDPNPEIRAVAVKRLEAVGSKWMAALDQSN